MEETRLKMMPTEILHKSFSSPKNGNSTRQKYPYGVSSQLQFRYAIKEIRTEMGMEAPEVQNLCQQMFSVSVTELNRTQASTFIQSLKVAKQNGNPAQATDDIPF